MVTIIDEESSLIGRIQAFRWKDGLKCPRCGLRHCSIHAHGKNGRRKLRCSDCGRTFTDLTGTPLARTHLSLTLWAAAARMMLRGHPTCSELSIKLKVKIATAWRVRKILTLALNDKGLCQALVHEDKA